MIVKQVDDLRSVLSRRGAKAARWPFDVRYATRTLRGSGRPVL